jgi:hypothetical protein
MQTLLAPNLIVPVIRPARIRFVRTRRVAVDVLARLEFHKYLLVLHQGRLIVDQQLAGILYLSLGDERIVDQVGQDARNTLTNYLGIKSTSGARHRPQAAFAPR